MQKYKHIVPQIAVIICVFLLGTVFGRSLSRAEDPIIMPEVAHSDGSAETAADFAPFWKTWQILNKKFPHAEKIQDSDRVWGAIKGLASSMNDPYTVFFSPEETKDFNSTIAGEFGGIGMEVGMKDGIITVIAPLKGTPSYDSGIKAGDKIIKIDGVSTADMTIDQAIDKIRGEKGTPVKLTIFREGISVPKEFTLIRDTISLPTLEEKEAANGVKIISIYNFNANVYDLFLAAIRNFIGSGLKKLVIDLRGNPGGYLDEAINMASWFIPEGKVVVTEDYGDIAKPDHHLSKGYDGFPRDAKIVILVDKGSASASEIFAGALSEYKIATLVGEQTFGKGSVQELVPITKDTALKVTIAKWLTPNGISISEHGLTPDIVVKSKDSTTDYSKDDLQFKKALEILNK